MRTRRRLTYNVGTAGKRDNERALSPIVSINGGREMVGKEKGGGKGEEKNGRNKNNEKRFHKLQKTAKNVV